MYLLTTCEGVYMIQYPHLPICITMPSSPYLLYIHVDLLAFPMAHPLEVLAPRPLGVDLALAPCPLEADLALAPRPDQLRVAPKPRPLEADPHPDQAPKPHPLEADLAPVPCPLEQEDVHFELLPLQDLEPHPLLEPRPLSDPLCIGEALVMATHPLESAIFPQGPAMAHPLPQGPAMANPQGLAMPRPLQVHLLLGKFRHMVLTWDHAQ